ELLTEILRNTVKVDTRIYACGPKLMLREVSRLATEYSLPCEISLEEHMGCGVGACLGCVCKGVPKFGKENLRRVCTDGPVFESREVVWE
ncbi:MAG TPA: hypothetical protein VNU93_09855, partial [Verrucomicrobiae bacterium]|nr:hypothetical protein [Verrucomicrobiae bacterium]